MGAQGAGRQPRAHRAAQRGADGLSLAGAVGQQNDAAGLEYRADSLRDGPARDLRGIVEEARVVADRRRREVDRARPRVERGPRLVEADMAVGAYTEDLEIDAPRLLDEGLVARRLRLEIARRSVDEVDVLLVDVDVPEQVVAQVAAIALGMVGGQAGVFVEMEHAHAREIEALLAMQPRQLGIQT